MLVVVAYDVNTETAAGRKRLRKLAKCCQAYGQRVQSSVFECAVDASDLVALKAQISEIIDVGLDNVKLYRLGNNYHGKVEEIGLKKSYDAEGFLCL